MDAVELRAGLLGLQLELLLGILLCLLMLLARAALDDLGIETSGQAVGQS